MSDSQMVVADKYRLTEFESVQKGTFKQDGTKELIFKGKIVKRRFVEIENEQPNNVKWIIDEEATKQLEIDRQRNIEENAERARREQMSTADLVDALTGRSSSKPEPKKKATKKEETPIEKSETPDETWKESELREYLKENDISYSPRHKKDKLIELATKNA